MPAWHQPRRHPRRACHRDQSTDTHGWPQPPSLGPTRSQYSGRGARTVLLHRSSIEFPSITHRSGRSCGHTTSSINQNHPTRPQPTTNNYPFPPAAHPHSLPTLNRTLSPPTTQPRPPSLDSIRSLSISKEQPCPSPPLSGTPKCLTPPKPQDSQF